MSGTTSPASGTSVYAAGALVWRQQGDKIRILVIHRDRHDDHSLPKGKVDPGESLPETAAREVLEETGYAVALGAPLGFIEYDLPDGRHKEVHYWAAELPHDDFERTAFVPNDEVDECRWVGLKRAQKLLTYERDRELVNVFAERVAAQTHRTFAVIALRHAKAVPAPSWPGDDASRPLTARGQEQSEAAAAILRAFGPERIITSTAIRCRSTVGPVAAQLGVAPVAERDISQAAYDAGDEGVDAIVREVLATSLTTILCSHSPVMPAIVSAVARFTGTRLGRLSRHAMLSTAECAVLHVPSAHPELGIVAAETHGPLV